jgi:hypothetical protein
VYGAVMPAAHRAATLYVVSTLLIAFLKSSIKKVFPVLACNLYFSAKNFPRALFLYFKFDSR